MINQFRLQNFKSWRDTGEIRFAPLTAFFGANSSGKTAILQFLVVLKQTVESSDRNRVLHLGGDKNSYVDLGTFYDVVHKHEMLRKVEFSIQGDLEKPLTFDFVQFEDNGDSYPFNAQQTVYYLSFNAVIEVNKQVVQVDKFQYNPNNFSIGMECITDRKYKFVSYAEIYDILTDIDINVEELKNSPAPIKCYEFPFPHLYQFSSAFESLFRDMYYLGPLRDYPKRLYVWSGEKPQDVGTRGEWTVAALLASPVEMQQQVAAWLKKLGLVYEFNLRVIAEGRREYEVMVKLTPESTEVPLTDVGFGVSQILPVLVLCYYVPEQSIVILEQPEIHLHPAIQANLADLLLEVIKTRRLQIILESHSEHLLRRLQRRLAEEVVTPEEIALYFTSLKGSESQLEPLTLDEYGNIHNWPENFFGDEFGDLAAMTEAAIMRQTSPNGNP